MADIINGLILSGGNSTRMGQDKSGIQFHGRPQREHLARLLKPYCSKVYISLQRELKKSVSEDIIYDQFDLKSPLNGVLSAFIFDPLIAWLSAPVDMPNIDDAAIEFLINHRDPKRAATCYFDSEGKYPEPLFTIWEPKSKPILFDFYNNGGHSPRNFLMENDCHILSAPNSKILININTREDLQHYLRQSDKTLQ